MVRVPLVTAVFLIAANFLHAGGPSGQTTGGRVVAAVHVDQEPRLDGRLD